MIYKLFIILMKEDHELKNLKNENIKNNKDSIFPWKMIIHILLVVLTTTQVINIIIIRRF